MKLTLIIPAYNEEKIIKKTLEKVLAYLSKEKYNWELLVVDDGSSDETAALVTDFSKKDKRVRLIKLQKNSGKGAALRAGVMETKGDFMIFSDADLSVPITNISKFLKILETESEVAIGSRRVKGAKIVIHQPLHREMMGRFFNWLTRVMMKVDVADFTCGFKGFRKKAAQKIFGRGFIDRWAYDSEILFLAKKFGYRITQVPIEWRDRKDTRVVLRKVIFESLVDLVKIRLYHRLGRYNNK